MFFRLPPPSEPNLSLEVLPSILSCRHENRRQAAFTLLEVMTCVLVILILLVMSAPLYNQVVRRAQRTSCMSNLKGLHTAANLYLQEHRMWPQVGTKGVDPKTVATNWISTLQPYGLNQINWICPTQQSVLQNPDLSDPDNIRIDYMGTPFDRNPMTPTRWATQPWFMESGDVHGNGNLVIFPDGHIQEIGDFLSLMKKTAKH